MSITAETSPRGKKLTIEFDIIYDSEVNNVKYDLTVRSRYVSGESYGRKLFLLPSLSSISFLRFSPPTQ